MRGKARSAARRALGITGSRAIALTVLLGIGCSSEPDAPAVDGPLDWEVGADPILVVGDSHTTDPDYLFDRITAVRLLPGGAVAVGDGSLSVRVFDEDGVLRHRLGGEGDGPGEFQNVSDIPVVAADTLAVYDASAQRLTTFVLGPQVSVSTVGFRSDAGWPELYLGSLPSGDHVLAWIRQAPRDPSAVTPDVMEFGRYSSEGDFVEVLGEDLGMRRLGSPLPFSPHFLGAVVGDAVLHADGLRPALHRTTSAGEGISDLQLPVEAVDASTAFRLLESAVDSGGRARLAELRGTPALDSVPAISDLIVARDGLVWLKRYDPGSDSHWLGRSRAGGSWFVSKGDGSIQANVAISDGFRLMDVDDGRVAGIVRDPLGIESVQIRTLSASN